MWRRTVKVKAPKRVWVMLKPLPFLCPSRIRNGGSGVDLHYPPLALTRARLSFRFSTYAASWCRYVNVSNATRADSAMYRFTTRL